MEFKLFLENEEEKNVKSTIAKLPRNHQKLLNGYKFRFTPGNTLNGDNNHIGYIHKDKIVVAGPWNYSREFTTLHEIAHLLYEHIIKPETKKAWKELLKETLKEQKDKLPAKCQSALEQDEEELFSMVYAATYAKHPPITYINKKWQDFIRNLP